MASPLIDKRAAAAGQCLELEDALLPIASALYLPSTLYELLRVQTGSSADHFPLTQAARTSALLRVIFISALSGRAQTSKQNRFLSVILSSTP